MKNPFNAQKRLPSPPTNQEMQFELPTTPPDWQDSAEGPISGQILSAKDAYHTAFTRLPAWFKFAFRLRNAVAAPFGLWTGSHIVNGPEAMLHLPVVEQTNSSYMLGLDDRHLSFAIHCQLQTGNARIKTSIWFNHWVGRLYLMVVWIPHKVTISTMLKRLA